LLAGGAPISILHACAVAGVVVDGKGSPPSSRLIRDAWDQPVRVSSLELATALGLESDIAPSEPDEPDDGTTATAPSAAPEAKKPEEGAAKGELGKDGKPKTEAQKKKDEADAKAKGKAAKAGEKGAKEKAEEEKKKAEAAAKAQQSYRGKKGADIAPPSEREVKKMDAAAMHRRMHIDYASFVRGPDGKPLQRIAERTAYGAPTANAMANKFPSSYSKPANAPAAAGSGGGSGAGTPKREASPRPPEKGEGKGKSKGKKGKGDADTPTTVLAMSANAPSAADAAPLANPPGAAPPPSERGKAGKKPGKK